MGIKHVLAGGVVFLTSAAFGQSSVSNGRQLPASAAFPNSVPLETFNKRLNKSGVKLDWSLPVPSGHVTIGGSSGTMITDRSGGSVIVKYTDIGGLDGTYPLPIAHLGGGTLSVQEPFQGGFTLNPIRSSSFVGGSTISAGSLAISGSGSVYGGIRLDLNGRGTGTFTANNPASGSATVTDLGATVNSGAGVTWNTASGEWTTGTWSAGATRNFQNSDYVSIDLSVGAGTINPGSADSGTLSSQTTIVPGNSTETAGDTALPALTESITSTEESSAPVDLTLPVSSDTGTALTDPLAAPLIAAPAPEPGMFGVVMISAGGLMLRRRRVLR